MLRHATVLIVIQVVFDATDISSALKIRDINNFIETLQRNEAKYNDARHDRSQADDNRDYVDISSQELDELINQMANDIYNQDKYIYNDHTNNQKESRNYKFGNLQNRNLEHFVISDTQRGKYNKGILSNPEENSLHAGFGNDHIFRDNGNKLYLILNPRANLNENNFKDIIGLLSQILSGTASRNIYSKQDYTRINKEPRYKGFVIAGGRQARRRNHESKELYSEKNSLENFKPKRVRSDYGGAGGRTPIPYIRHRDIFERE